MLDQVLPRLRIVQDFPHLEEARAQGGLGALAHAGAVLVFGGDAVGLIAGGAALARAELREGGVMDADDDGVLEGAFALGVDAGPPASSIDWGTLFGSTFQLEGAFGEDVVGGLAVAEFGEARGEDGEAFEAERDLDHVGC